MKRLFFFLIFSSVFLSIAAQTPQEVEKNKRDMERVLANSTNYLYASSSNVDKDVAINNALAQLAGQISTEVKVKIIHDISVTTKNGTINEEDVFVQTANVSTNVILHDCKVLITAVPDKKNSEYSVFVFIDKTTADEIEAEIKADVLKKRQWVYDAIQSYYDIGCRCLKQHGVGNALKHWYWAYAMSIGTDATIRVVEQDVERTELATTFIRAEIDNLLSNIQVTATSVKIEHFNESDEIINVGLLVEYNDKASESSWKVANLGYTYNDGIFDGIKGSGVTDGVTSLRLRSELDKVRFYCTYDYGKSETPDEVYEIVNQKKTVGFASAIKEVKITKEAKSTEEVVFDHKGFEFLLDKETITDAKKELNHDELLARMARIEKAIREKNYASVQQLFTDSGYVCFEKLVKTGKASIIGKPQYGFIDFGKLTICRSITMQFRFRNNKEFIKNVSFRFNSDNLVESLAFTLSEEAENNVLNVSDWDRDARLTLMTFLEDYQTAYALGRYKYLESIFSDNALIIVGYKVEETVLADGVRMPERVKYDTLSKKNFIERFKKLYDKKEYIHLNFTEIYFNRSSKNPNMYGIRIRQEYYSSDYGDVGFLFLLVDFSYDLPIIHIRAWQNDKLPLEYLIGLRDFYKIPQ